jgi:uncharacterized phage infection (PIP) family protein YhgE
MSWVDEEHALRNDVTALTESISAIRNAVGKNQSRTFNKRIKQYKVRLADLESEMGRDERNITQGEQRRRAEAVGSISNMVFRCEKLLSDRARGGTMFDNRCVCVCIVCVCVYCVCCVVLRWPCFIRVHCTSFEFSETSFTEGMDSVQLLQHQQDEIERQNAKLDEVLSGAQDIKSLSYDQQKELDMHAGLLTDIERGMDKADSHLRTNTEDIDDLDESSGSCWTSVIMIVLFALIVFLMVSNTACHIFNPKRC